MVSYQRPPVLAPNCALRRPVVESAMAVCNKAIEIFKVCKREFLVATKKSCHRIDCEKIVSALVNNCYVTSNFDDICKSADCLISKEISMNLMSTLILLYVRVHSYSLAKKIKERSKVSTIKPTEKNSLCKTIKKASGSSDRYDLN